jgi:murein DD-endopeptidase MepM/ murein hydrolase activator NlpD
MTYLPKRTVLILLAGAALGACASPNYPIGPQVVQVPPPAAPAPPPRMAEAEPERAQPVAPVESQPLAPPPARAPEAPVAPPPAAQVEAPPVRPREPAYRTVTTRTVTGRVVEVDGPARTYKVKKGDNLQRVADQLDTTVEDLAKGNKLKKPYVIHPGDTLKGPGRPAKAYVVDRGDTLFAVARRFGVSVEALRAENDLGRNASLSSGRRLRLPAGYRDRGPISTSTRVEVDAPREAESTPQPVRPRRRAEPSEPTDTVVTRSVTGRVVDIDGPAKSYKVKKGDNLARIAERLDTDIEQLAKDNRLKKPYRLQPGQTLRGPSSDAKAYVVGQGDTLSAIAQRFGVTEAALRAANGLRRGAGVAPGRRLRLPTGYRDRGPIVSRTTVDLPPASSRDERPEPPVYTPPPPEAPAVLPSSPRPYTGAPSRPSRPPPSRPSGPSGVAPSLPVAAPPPTDAQIMQMGRGVFAWPIRGDIIAGFGGRGSGPRNDGLNIRAGAGDAVRAAASGDVVYAGDQVPGFGNLVLIKHADGWVTAYGHLGRVEVRMQQKVTQGQQIGQAGSTGGVSEPQLHFEVRYAPNPQERARPVDPTLVLPR